MKIELNNNNDKELKDFFNNAIEILKKGNFEIFKFKIKDCDDQLYFSNLGFIDRNLIIKFEFEYVQCLNKYSLNVIGKGFQLIVYFRKR